MTKRLLLVSTLATSFSLTSCTSIAESMIGGLLGSNDNDDEYHESREKRERRALYRSEGKPTLHSN